MGYHYDKEKKCWLAYYSKRHPKTNKPIGLRRRARSEKHAKQVERELVLAIEEKINIVNRPLWPVLIEQYLNACRERDLAKKTIYNAEKCLNAATMPKWSKCIADTITTQEIRDLILVDFKESATSHKKNILKFIRGVFNHAVETGAMTRNPVPQMKFRTPNKIKCCLTAEQVLIFLTKARALRWEWYPHCAMALYTGMRNGELYALTWDKVNINDRQILVDCSWNNKDSFKSTKSGDDRIVEIAPNLLPILKELKLKSQLSSFVLPRIGRWDKGEQARELRMFLLGIGLPEMRFHDLRATWATLMLSKGVEPIKVMIMGGWKEMKTMQIYMRKAGVDIRGITDTLDLHNPNFEEGGVVKFAGL